MQVGWGRRIAAGLVLIAVSGTLSGFAQAQDASPSAFTVTGSILTTVEIDDNGPLSAVSPGTDLTFGTLIELVATLETPRSSLSFGFGGTFQAERLAGTRREENGFVNPSVDLDYQLEGPNSLLSLSGNYSQSDVADSFSFDSDNDLVDDVFLATVGEVEQIGVSLDLSLGVEAPFGVDLSLSRSEVDYSNTVSPGLYDTTTDTARITARLRPTETVTASVFVEEQRYEAEDVLSTDRTTRTIGLGLDYEINPVLTFSGEIGHVDVEENTLPLGLPVSTGSEDYAFDASLTQDLPNGTVSLNLARILGTNVARTELGVGRSMELPSGDLSFGLGVSDGDPGKSVLTAFVDYTHEFPGAVLSLSASRETSIDSENDQSVTTSFGVTYDRELTPTAGVMLQLNHLDIDDIGSGGAAEGSRTELNLTYSQELTEDWDWSLGYVGRRSKSATGSTASSNAIVFSVGRSFSLRP